MTHDTDTAIQLSPELGTVESELKTLQQTVERKESLAKQSEQRKNDLVIYSAHDIKTPLTSVLGYLILLNGNPDLPTEERKKYTGIALDKTRELDSLINELFEITRYNLSEIELEKTWINLYDMLSEIKEEQYPQLNAAQKQDEIEVNEDIRLNGDPDKLVRVFNNLLRNAVLYSDANTIIKISASTTGEQVDIAFENTCAPISEAKLNRLFEQFYRGKEYPSNTPGSGLGLAIAKEIILLHGGSIRAESTETGIRFLVTFPVMKRESMKIKKLHIQHKLIKPYTPRHNGKVERSHRKDNEYFYASHKFYSFDDYQKQLAVWNRKYNNFPMRPLNWLSPKQVLLSFPNSVTHH